MFDLLFRDVIIKITFGEIIKFSVNDFEGAVKVIS